MVPVIRIPSSCSGGSASPWVTPIVACTIVGEPTHNPCHGGATTRQSGDRLRKGRYRRRRWRVVGTCCNRPQQVHGGGAPVGRGWAAVTSGRRRLRLYAATSIPSKTPPPCTCLGLS